LHSVDCRHSFRSDSKKTLRTPASFRRGVALARFDVALFLKAVKSGIDGADRYLTIGSEFDLPPNGDSVGSIVQTQQRQNNNVFKFTEVITDRHYLYNIDKIAFGQNDRKSPRLGDWFKIFSFAQGDSMMRIVLLLSVVLALIVLVPRLLSRSTPPTAGSSAPDFTLPSQDGSPVSLKDYHGKWVVLYFYPRDQTPGCSREAHNFQLDQPKYAERNAVVLGVSLDSVDSHQKFCAKEGLNFKLLADTDHKVTSSYGTLTNLGVVKLAARHTFLIDPSGKIAKAYTRVDPLQHSVEVLAELDQLQKAEARR
jgi:peroxiredoxin Q/BCP